MSTDLHNDGAPPRAHTYPVPRIRVLDDSERNQLAELRHEACEHHCAGCGRCDNEPTGPTTWRDIEMHQFGDDWYCDECIPETWQPPTPADGYNPGPELSVSHDGLTLTVQRTHLLDDRADYYWQILTDGTLVPLTDGTMKVYEPTMPLTRVAAHLAWHWYHRDMPNVLAMWGWPAIHIYPTTTRTPNPEQRAALHIIHQEALT